MLNICKSHRSLFSPLACSIVISFVVFFTTQAQAGLPHVFWTEDFDSYPPGPSIDGQDSTWEVISSTVVVSNNHYHSPENSLHIAHHWQSGPGRVRWYDDTPTAPHGELMELDWWMYRYPETYWEVDVRGWNGNQVVGLANQRVGSNSTIDILTDTGWEETLAIITEGNWQHVFLEMNFDLSPVQYRMAVSDTEYPGDWFGWYSVGNDADYFRYVELVSRDEDHDVYFDDFAASVPELATVALLGFGSLSLIRRRRK